MLIQATICFWCLKTKRVLHAHSKKKRRATRERKKNRWRQVAHTRGQWKSQRGWERGAVGRGLCHIDGDAVRMSLVCFLRCPALNLCAKSLSRQLLNSRMFCSCCVFLVSVLCRFLRQLSARLPKLPSLLGRFVPDKLCEAAPLSAQTRTHFDHFSSCNFV